MKKLIQLLQSLISIILKPKAQETTQTTPNNPIPVPATPIENVNIALIVGHNQIEQGAVNYKGESEWSFNSRIAIKVSEMVARTHNKGIYIIHRPGGTYTNQVNHVVKECKRLGIEVAMELHFNANSSAKVQRTEILITNTPTVRDDNISKFIAEKVSSMFGFSVYGKFGIKTIENGHTGYRMIHELHKAGVISMIVEPLFGTHPTEAVKKFFDNEDEYVMILAKTISEVIESKL